MSRIPLPEGADRHSDALLDWYRTHRRDLPWRRTRDPYAVWVSEIMLQQTRVETVIPFYESWLRRFPGIRELAAAPIDDVLKAWEGLGYYRRARNLHRTAGILLERYGGELPPGADLLRTLPGIGESTAGAISSIAFGAREPVLDGNVKRILSRLFLIGGGVDQPRTLRRLRDTARELLPDRDAGEHNQALMDLGATVCLPRRPDCGSCPLGGRCLAREHAVQSDYPGRSARTALPHFEVAAGLIRDGDRLLIVRRADEAMLGGLWEFPGGRVEPGETPAECLLRIVLAIAGIPLSDLRPFLTVRHAYSHFTITMHVFEGTPASPGVAGVGPGMTWEDVDGLDRHAFDGASRKIIEKLR